MYHVKKIPLLQYYTDFWMYYASFVLNELVNDLTIINQNATGNITVNNITLVPGQEFNAGGNNGEINKQTYTVNVDSSATAPKVVVLLKRYSDVTLM